MGPPTTMALGRRSDDGSDDYLDSGGVGDHDHLRPHRPHQPVNTQSRVGNRVITPVAGFWTRANSWFTIAPSTFEKC